MLFNSFKFIFLFLPLVLVVAKALRGHLLLFWIAFASFVFYAYAGHVWFLLPMTVTTVLDFFLGMQIAAAVTPRKKRALLLISLTGNLGLLVYFKYSALFLTTASKVALLLDVGAQPAWLRFFDVVLPAGISFYTFQTLSYIIDVYRGHCPPERNFLRFTGFVTFFPHLVAGPLTRHHQLIPALDRISKTGIKPRWNAGIFLFSIGLCKKVLIADRIANFIDPMLAECGRLGLASGWLAILGYSLQIYFDFSGYSDMAIGIGRLFGIELPQNFNSPYQALNPSDFWRRWHMTLSFWLRDYLYISLGGNRCSSRRQKLNLLATMVLGGFWHGAQWTFAAWGLFHGLLLVFYHSWGKRWDGLPVGAQRALCFVLVCVGWVFFRARTFPEAWHWLGAMLGLQGLGIKSLNLESAELAALVAVALLLANAFRAASSLKELELLTKWRQIGLGFATSVAILLMSYSSKFLYFQF